MKTTETLITANAAEQAVTAELSERIRAEIASFGDISFARFMELALYAPHLGYYMRDHSIFGEHGDYTTAPELSPLFSFCVADAIKSTLHHLGEKAAILECGAGRGTMAANILHYLNQINCLPAYYYIFEISPVLRHKQQATLQAIVPDLLNRVVWLDQLAIDDFHGVVLGNEFIDALPVHRFCWQKQGFQELRVHCVNEKFAWCKTAVKSTGLDSALASIALPLSEGYRGEIRLQLTPLLMKLAQLVKRGCMLIIDYGYPRETFYHPERRDGTLSCFFHHQHHAYALEHPGLQDISAHVDFSQLAAIAEQQGFSAAGFSNQANFLINNGIEKHLTNATTSKDYFKQTQALKRLMMPDEMGEIVKVLALSKNFEQRPQGFAQFDRLESLFTQQIS